MENQNDLSLANTALNLIGSDRIPSLDNTVNSKTIQLVNQYLPLAKQETLRARDWNCVRARRTLDALDSNLSLGEWLYAFRLPDDFLCMRRFISEFEEVRFAAYNVEIDETDKRVLFTSCGVNAVIYTRNVTDVNRWDASLFMACAAKLALYLIGPIVRDFKMQQVAMGLAQAQFEEAIGVNEGEGGHDRAYESTLVSVRF